MTQNSVDNKNTVDKETNVFDVIKNISSGKDTSKATTEKLLLEYNAFIVNKGFSLYLDTILYSNEMNLNNKIPRKYQYEYYMNVIRKKNRWTKWPAKSEDVFDKLSLISRAYNVNLRRASTINKLLSKKQFKQIEQRYSKKDESENNE